MGKNKKGLESIMVGSTLLESIGAINKIIQRINLLQIQLNSLEREFDNGYVESDEKRSKVLRESFIKKGGVNPPPPEDVQPPPPPPPQKPPPPSQNCDCERCQKDRALEQMEPMMDDELNEQVDEAMQIEITKEDRERLIALLKG